jgi:hypothetical protein
VRIPLKPRINADKVTTWQSAFARTAGNGLIWAVMASPESDPMLVAANPQNGANDCGWAAGRLARCAYIESALLEFLAELRNVAVRNPGGMNTPIQLAAVMMHIAKVYNQQVPIADGAVN